MSGKAYTMKEMKSIVEYLTEHKGFAEIKGRKMWVDFANSKLTNRTWQSLKETFLKRILPDIHNPYYKLTMDQIRCFREGCDVVAREKNKLEIIEVEDDSNSNAEKEVGNEKPSTSHNNNGEATPGEDVNCAKIQSHDRASVDTVIITNCYETDDDLRRVLESSPVPTCENKENPNKNPPSKSLRDLITYSEPLTPMLQKVLNDFASEDDSDGERMQIIESSSEVDHINSEPVIEILDSDGLIENNNATNDILSKDNSKQDKAGEVILSHETTEVTVKRETSTDDIDMMDTDAIDNANRDKAEVDNVSKNTAAVEDNAKKDAVTDSVPNKTVKDNLKTYKSKKKINRKKGNASDGNVKKDIAAGAKINQDEPKEQVTDKNKVAEDTPEKEKLATIATEAVLENNIPTENLEKSNENDIEKDKTTEISQKTAEEIEQNGNSNAEEVVQPKVLLKLRKCKKSDKVEVKNPSSKHNIKIRAEMYEVVEHEILEKSTSNVVQVDDLSNYANDNDEIVSSTVSDKPTQNSSNSDTILPNNQEALNNTEKCTSTDDQTRKDTSKSPHIPDKVVKPKTTRKRAISQDVASTSKIKKSMLNVNGTEKAVSDTDDIVMKELIKSKLTKSKLALKKKLVGIEVENETTKPDETTKANEIIKANETTGKTDAEDKIISEDVPPASQPIVIDSSQASELNPCLKSVSLFAEQFNTVSYIDSENEHETTPAASATDKKVNKPSTSKTSEKKKEIASANVEDKNEDISAKMFKSFANNVDEVVMLRSRSESESEPKASSVNKMPVSQDVAKSQRDKALANVFGFISGGLKRKKRTSYRKNAAYHHHHQRREREESSCDSSEWTSESDSEAYVSPPRGRKSKQSRKYLKPHSARILSLEDEGGLFVMYGKKIYPLVKDGKTIKNYLTYLPESDPEEEESYWKLKYVEERKRVAELRKLMKENEEEVAREKSPILPARPMRLSTSHHQGTPIKNAPNKEISKENIVDAPEKETKEVANDTGKTLKITFAKNNQEVHMEGHWSHIHPVLAEVVQIFNKEVDAPANLPAPVATKRPSVTTSDISVVGPSPVNEDILEKVNKLETEIFKEIEDRAQEEDAEQPKEQTDTNVTQRKRASRVSKSSSTQRSSTHSSADSVRSAKRQKISTDEPKDEVQEQEKASKTRNKKDSIVDIKDDKSTEGTKDAVDAVDSTSSVATKRSTRTPKKNAKEAVNVKELNTRSRRSKANSSQVGEDSDIRYMFPPTARTKRSTLNVSKSKEKSKRYMANPSKIFSSLQLPTLHDESTQGYQDSDVSPPKASLRRKRRLSLSTVLYKTKNINHRAKRKSLPCIIDGDSSDTSSAFQIIVRPTSNSSLKSEAYRSDSYQLLFPQNKNVFKPLEKIDEDSSVPDNRLHPNRFAGLESYGKSLEVRVNRLNDDILRYYIQGNTDGNSSNVSLPLSPELSIVENLSISKELINSVESNYPTINETQANKKAEQVFHNKYLISQVDVSMPLMQQECGLHESVGEKIKTEPSFDHKMSVASDSLLNRIGTVNIEEAPSLSDSLDTRLRNLLLESAKKISMPSIQEVPKVKLPSVELAQKKGKRCSTPRKKKDLKKPNLPIVDPVVEEEFMESCSYGGRKSCPPAITVISEDLIHKENLSKDKDTVTEKSKGRRKKDVIKVKILRPRNRSSQSRSPEVTRNSSKTTVNTDSGINESGLTVQGFNDSVDLIHNHSETCLLANECMGNSVEFIETNTRSIISLNTNSATSPERISRERFVFQDCQDFVPDLFCQNAQSFCNVDYVPDSVKLVPDNTSDTVYHSPMVSEVSINSLITEDLSDETPQNSQPTKWYLLSEDDTSGTNAASRSTPNSIPSNFGANLKQIFPITCAVPNLSTITENSNDNSRKQTINSMNSTRHDLDSQNMFDMNSN